MQKDCILVLGAGITKEGELTQIGRSRVEKAVSAYRSNQSSRILLSGRYSHGLSFIPPRTEAQAMKEYALNLGVQKEHIYLDEHSMDTLGGAYFSKQFFLKYNWKNILIITSNFHLARTQYLFKKVYGKEFNFEIVPSLTFLPPEDLMRHIELEVQTINKYKSQIDQINDGDDISIKSILLQMPWYSSLASYLTKVI